MSSHRCVIQEILELNGYDMQSLYDLAPFLLFSIIPLIDGNRNSERCDINYLPYSMFYTGDINTK